MGRGQEQPGLRHRRLPTPADEEEHVPRDAADGVGSTEGRRQQQLVASPSVRRKLRERQERLEARGRAPSVGTTTKRRKGLWACLWVGLVGLVLPALAVLATAWRKYRSPHPIGFGAAWVSLMTGFFPLIEHDEEHRLDLDALHVSRKRLESSNMLNIGACVCAVVCLWVPDGFTRRVFFCLPTRRPLFSNLRTPPQINTHSPRDRGHGGHPGAVYQGQPQRPHPPLPAAPHRRGPGPPPRHRLDPRRCVFQADGVKAINSNDHD